MDKQQVRSHCLQARNALTQEEVRIKSEQIIHRLKPYVQGCVASYLAIGNEVNVTPLHAYISNLALPRVMRPTVMQFYHIDKATRYEKSRMGIWEPYPTSLMEADTIDVMIIPLVGFDSQCHRLGYGGGYYDRYLIQTNALRIGVAFECQHCDIIPIDSYDIPLDMIISEQHSYQADE